jgi:SAM-dependent methyltransferase
VSGQRAPGDIFSAVSAGYAAFRPRYPRPLFDFIASVAPRRDRALECGAGSGQATVDLAEWFDHVVATDVSASQIAQAPRHDRILWVVAPAEALPLRAGSIDLVGVAQALHWFDFDAFFSEVRRVASRGAVLVAWTYAAGRMDGEIGELLRRFTFETVGPYWPPQRRHVDAEYQTIPFPFNRIATPALELEDHWPLARLVGFMRTWSAVTRFRARRGEDPVAAVESDLASLWGDVEQPRRIVWPMAMLAGRISPA